MSYFNHKWKSFLNESKKEGSKKLLNEKGPMPDMGASVQTDVIKLPQLKLSDNWGKPGNEDRGVVERVMRNIGKRGSNPFERIDAVNQFITECDQACREGLDTSKIISNLMFLDVFSALAYEFNPATAGFLFENFLLNHFSVFFHYSYTIQIPNTGKKFYPNTVTEFTKFFDLFFCKF